MTDPRLQGYLEERRKLVDQALERFLPLPTDRPPKIHEAMRYSVFAGGKRLRPILVIAAAEAVGGQADQALPAAAAIECIHTYSLIHDDLPAMDDDDFRRGRPTCHKVYGEAIAILAGDALLTKAFILLSMPDGGGGVLPQRRLDIIQEMAVAAGSRGMVGGQVMDMLSEAREVDRPTLLYLHTHKTGALFRAALRVGGMVGGADDRQLEGLTRYGDRVGLAFQIVDDILDLEGETEELGKPKGSDLKRRKVTYPALMGIEESKRQARQLGGEAVASLEGFGEEAWPLRALAEFVVSRRK